jgi:hypothetical protein
LPKIGKYHSQQIREILMFPTSSTTQVISPFGSGYVPEQHGDPALSKFAALDVEEVVELLRASMFREVLKSLRGALSIG